MPVSDPALAPVITCKSNGPYLVKGLATLTSSRGEALATGETIALCRCGGSSKKPFCDGTHAKIGFEDGKQAGRSKDKRRDYAGKAITIHDNRGLCAHAGECTQRLSSVWRMGAKPWIDPDAASVDAIIETIEACPSGALSYSIGGEEHRGPNRPGAIRLAKNGPYLVTGHIMLQGVEFAEGASREHFTLCRCGASKNKPFCDGSHYDTGFEHVEG
jgi:CDGSH-type Zn-finger protein